MKNVYLLVGSEDGPMGIFSSHKKALAAAIDYCSQTHFESTPPPIVNDTKYCTLVSGLNASAEIRKDISLNYWHFTSS
tara:strand:- start:1350 stop:1583 length:234 start_codon:yes stop_codon:yes gene_type:complete